MVKDDMDLLKEYEDKISKIEKDFADTELFENPKFKIKNINNL